MRFLSTRKKTIPVDLKQAVLDPLASDGGLYLPERILPLNTSFLSSIKSKSFCDLAFEVCCHLIGNSIPHSQLRKIIEASITFPTPLVQIKNNIHSLELWHGPTLAFKDFGARFMAQLVSYLTQSDQNKTTILVATSGDTGGAVASGFEGVENVDVVILFPKSKVSHFQRLQMTTGGDNIHALQVNGTFDDCQKIVKQAFLDPELNEVMQLSSANSINIGRLIPQCFYYFEAYKQLTQKDKPVVFSIPSGNFGNLCAGLIAKAMGLDINQFIAATNINDTATEFFRTGIYLPKAAKQTISSAMDVGDPSNMERIRYLYNDDLEQLKRDIQSYSINDARTKSMIQAMKNNYLLDPHGAVALVALERFMHEHPNYQGVFLETAHPSKFSSVMTDIVGNMELSQKLIALKDLPEKYLSIPNDFNLLKEYLLSIKS